MSSHIDENNVTPPTKFWRFWNNCCRPQREKNTTPAVQLKSKTKRLLVIKSIPEFSLIGRKRDKWQAWRNCLKMNKDAPWYRQNHPGWVQPCTEGTVTLVGRTDLWTSFLAVVWTRRSCASCWWHAGWQPPPPWSDFDPKRRHMTCEKNKQNE